jgi:hypothetical protein
MKSLKTCRVLHFSASNLIEKNSTGGQSNACLLLPTDGSEDRQSNKNTTLASKDIIRQMNLSNCGLVFLSRFGVTDDIYDPRRCNCEKNFEFIESFLLAGASTVLYPLWNGHMQGRSFISSYIIRTTLLNVFLWLAF